MKVTFLDSGHEPKCAPDPAFPEGRDVDLSKGASKTCAADLPYPAPRCGVMMLKCERCGYSAAVTVAGRIDDPRKVTLPCKLH
jgi:hypothetical protein